MPCHDCGGSRVPERISTQTRSVVAPEPAAPTQVLPWTSLPLYKGAELPEDMDFIGGSSELGKAWRVPVERILPGGSLNPLRYAVRKGLSTVEVQRGMIVPVYFPNAAEPVEAAQAVAGRYAQALAIAEENGHLIIQNSGFLTFPRTHKYTVGKTYYLSKDVAGEVVSVKPSGTAQPLFTVIDAVTIAINMGAV